MARFKQKNLDLSYRKYVTSCLRMLTESNANFAGGPYMMKEWDGENRKPVDNRTPQEITDDIVKKGGLVVRHSTEEKGGES